MIAKSKQFFSLCYICNIGFKHVWDSENGRGHSKVNARTRQFFFFIMNFILRTASLKWTRISSFKNHKTSAYYDPYNGIQTLIPLTRMWNCSGKYLCVRMQCYESPFELLPLSSDTREVLFRRRVHFINADIHFRLRKYITNINRHLCRLSVLVSPSPCNAPSALWI